MTTRTHRTWSVIARVATGFSTFILAVILSAHYNPLGPNVSPGDLASQNLSRIVISKTEIPSGSRIIAEQLQVTQIPRTLVPDGAFTRIDDTLIGRVATTKIVAREPITENQLAPVGSAAALSAMIPEGYRAMTVRVDDIVGVSGFIQPNTLVDIVVVIEPSGGSGETGGVSKIVLQNIKVVASTQRVDAPKDDKEAARIRTVTLQVTPEQAEKLALASSEGKLQLVIVLETPERADEVRG
jgi:pilus assembly protein CpaB